MLFYIEKQRKSLRNRKYFLSLQPEYKCYFMNNMVIIESDQLEQIITNVVNRCLDERCINERMSNADEGYYDRDEMCELLHIAYPTLWRLEKSGKLQSEKVGRRKLYEKREVNRLIKSGKLAKYNRI